MSFTIYFWWEGRWFLKDPNSILYMQTNFAYVFVGSSIAISLLIFSTGSMICSSDSFTNLEFQIYNFFSTKYYVIFVLSFSVAQNWEKANKTFVFFFNWEILVKKIRRFIKQDSWNYLMSRSKLLREVTCEF